MRKQIIAGVVVITALVILAALNGNLLVDRNKNYLLGRLGQTLGHPVTTDRIELSYLPLAVRMVNLAVGNDPAVAASPLLRAKEIQISLRVLPLLLGQLLPDRVCLDAPVITILRDADGAYNYEPETTKKGRVRQPTNKDEKTANQPGLFAVPALQITNGTLRYRDLRNDGELVVGQIQLTMSAVAMDQPIEITLAAAVSTDQVNLQFKSRIGPIAGIADYRDYPIDGSLDAQQLDLGKINRALPQLRRATPRHLRFDGIYDIKNLKFKGTLNNLSLKGAVKGTDASFRFE